MQQQKDVLERGLAGRYRIDAPLGQGGMATVYRAMDLRHDRPVALKVLRPELAGALGPDRFLREIRITARLDHPGILSIFDSAETDGLLWYAMPLVLGESLRSWLQAGRKLPVPEAVRIAREVAEALDYAHGSGVVHRDVKPENILLRGSASQDRTSTAGWHPVIADFGIAHLEATAGDRLTSTGFTLGTAAYMSPEQAAGNRDIDARTDVYALGCVLYEMICGEPPFTGANPQAILARQLTEAPRAPHVTRPALSPELDRIMLRALEREPADRFQSAGALAEALSSAVAAGSAPARSRWPRAAVVAVGIAIAALGVYRLSPRSEEAPASAVDRRVVAVMPFVPSSGDTALSRLGRDLVFTLSATLDGIADLRTADPHSILALSAQQSGIRLADSAAALARRLGAGRLVEGSLVRIGGGVRVDVTVHDATTGEQIARESAEAPSDSIARFTDSLAIRLLPVLVPAGAFASGSLEGAFRTRSVPAIREFLTGERLLAQSLFEQASAAYARALDADSTFWLALARRVFAEDWVHNPQVGPLADTLIAHAADLPRRERLEIEARRALRDSSLESALRAHEAVVRAYPTGWFGWASYADHLTHHGPLVGRALEEGRNAWDRVVNLNPDLVFAWDHIGLLAALERDSIRLGNALAALERANPRPMDDYANMVLSFRLLDRLVRGDSAGAAIALDSVIADKISPGRNPFSFYEPLLFGFPEWQRRMADAMIPRGSASRAQDYRRLRAMSLAAAGRWDSALASATEPLFARRLEILGVAVDAWPAESLASEAPPRADAEGIFLDGIAAAMMGDRGGVAGALERLRQRNEPGAAAAATALETHLTVLSGDTSAAGRALAALEWRRANLPLPVAAGEFPSVTPLNRIFAARWLAASGLSEEAERLLRIADAPFAIIPSSDYSGFLRENIKRIGQEIDAGGP